VLVADLISGVSSGLKLTIIDHFLYVRSLLIGRSVLNWFRHHIFHAPKKIKKEIPVPI
jgi:hypothetical protein